MRSGLFVLLIACCATGAAFAPVEQPILLYNGSPSAPIGFYVRDLRPIGLLGATGAERQHQGGDEDRQEAFRWHGSLGLG